MTPPSGAQIERVLGAADRQAGGIVRERGCERGGRLRAANVQLAHVREVEQADVRPDRDVLVDDAPVADRHLPAAEGREPGTRLDVPLVEGGASRLVAQFGRTAASGTIPATGKARARMSRSVG